jgi:hypothetical protein
MRMEQQPAKQLCPTVASATENDRFEFPHCRQIRFYKQRSTRQRPCYSLRQILP